MYEKWALPMTPSSIVLLGQGLVSVDKRLSAKPDALWLACPAGTVSGIQGFISIPKDGFVLF